MGSRVSRQRRLSPQDALLKACRFQQNDKVQKLLTQGTNPNCPNDFTHRRQSIMHLSRVLSKYDLFEPQLLRVIIELAIPRPTQTQPLHLAVDGDNFGLILMLLQYKADIEARDEEGFTPLLRAQKEWGLETVTNILLSKGANVNAQCYQHSTALMWAVRQEAYLTVQDLLNCKADPNLHTNGQTPLFFAAYDGNVTLVRLLLQAKARPDMANVHGNTALMVAAWHGHTEVVRCLLHHSGDEGDSVFQISGNPNHSHQPLGLKDPTFPTLCNAREETPLMFATFNLHVDTVELLLEAQANPDAQDHLGQTALMIAARTTCKNLLRLLRRACRHPELTDYRGQTWKDWYRASQPPLSGPVMESAASPPPVESEAALLQMENEVTLLRMEHETHRRHATVSDPLGLPLLDTKPWSQPMIRRLHFV